MNGGRAPVGTCRGGGGVDQQKKKWTITLRHDGQGCPGWPNYTTLRDSIPAMCQNVNRGLLATTRGGGGLPRDSLDGETSPPPRILKLAVISWWALDGSFHFQCIPVTQPLHVANKHIFVPSPPSVRRCTRLDSQYSRASEFAVKLLVTRRENVATCLNGEIFPAKLSPPESPTPRTAQRIGSQMQSGRQGGVHPSREVTHSWRVSATRPQRMAH